MATLAATITDVTARQNYPWNGKVMISYTVTGDIAGEAASRGGTPELVVQALNRETGAKYVATALSGDTSLAAGTHEVVWDFARQGITVESTGVFFSVLCKLTSSGGSSTTSTAPYMVIDLSGGKYAASYPVTYLNAVPAGGWTDEYKTTKLVLKRIEAGSFIMGEDQNDEVCRTTITKPFYMGVFEVTQKQWALVMGLEVEFDWEEEAMAKKTGISYDSIRGSMQGAGWPTSSAVDATSFIGRIRAKTGNAAFDMPTEAQWEYATRLGELGGDGYEWCLDWYNDLLSYGNDPKGPSGNYGRVLRYIGSFHRGYYAPSESYGDTGFRLVCSAGPFK